MTNPDDVLAVEAVARSNREAERIADEIRARKRHPTGYRTGPDGNLEELPAKSVPRVTKPDPEPALRRSDEHKARMEDYDRQRLYDLVKSALRAVERLEDKVDVLVRAADIRFDALEGALDLTFDRVESVEDKTDELYKAVLRLERQAVKNG